MDSPRELRTGRLIMRPVGGGDLADIAALKADPRVFAIMLGGVRTPEQSARELADDIAFWGRSGVGMWSLREATGGAFVGIAGIMERPDGRGLSIRFALRPEWHGRGYASEAAGAALRFAHEVAGLKRIVGVARESNVASRTVLGAIGMRLAETFERDGHRMMAFESVRP